MQKKKSASAFIRNINDILQREQLHQTISWAEDGYGFIIKNLEKFEAQILPQYFKHKKYTSFVRQVILFQIWQEIEILPNIFLNMYGFHKQRHGNSDNYFKHDQFKKGQILLTEIKRKPQKKKMSCDQSQKKQSQHYPIQQESHVSKQSQIMLISEMLLKQHESLLKMNSKIRKAVLQVKDRKIEILKMQQTQNQDMVEQLENQQLKKLESLTEILINETYQLNKLVQQQQL